MDAEAESTTSCRVEAKLRILVIRKAAPIGAVASFRHNAQVIQGACVGSCPAGSCSQLQWDSTWVRAPGESGPPSSGILLLTVLGERQLRGYKATGARQEPQTPAQRTSPTACPCAHSLDPALAG